MAIDQDKLRKVATMAERSQNDGEALNAFRSLVRMLEAEGLSLAEVLEKGAAANAPRTVMAGWEGIFNAATEQAFGGARAPQAPQPRPQAEPREVTLLAGELPRRFCARFEILNTGATKAGKAMASVKLTLSRTAEDVLKNVTRVAFANAFGGLAESLADLESELCEMTAEPSRKPYPDTLTSAVCAKASGATAWANA